MPAAGMRDVGTRADPPAEHGELSPDRAQHLHAGQDAPQDQPAISRTLPAALQIGLDKGSRPAARSSGDK